MAKKFRFVLFGFLAAITILVSIPIVFSALDHLGLSDASHWWFGLDFVPALWLWVPAVVVGLIWLALRRWKFAAVWLALVTAYLLAFGDLSARTVFSAIARHEQSPNRITVSALNVEYYSEGIQKVLQGIRQMNSDVVLLSENNADSAGVETIRRIMPEYGYFSGHRYSTAILSRLPIREVHEVELPSHEASLSAGNDPDLQSANPHRSFVHAIIEKGGKTVNVISVRLIAGRPKDHSVRENLRWGRYLLETQLQETDAFVSYLRNLRGPVVFGGDMNAPPKSKTMRPIEAVATDAYFADHLWGDLTFRTSFPTLRLDFLFGMNGAIPVRSQVVRLDVSDHFPVLAEFDLGQEMMTGR
jgi:endonuclease/exonuclease/phosphatase (EEP) superfamily protein YafD